MSNIVSKWYHGTNEENVEQIIENGFQPQSGTYGKGVYFSSSKEGARIFGNYILTVIIDDIHIAKERTKGISALAIVYPSGETELCVYDPRIIKQIWY